MISVYGVRQGILLLSTVHEEEREKEREKRKKERRRKKRREKTGEEEKREDNLRQGSKENTIHGKGEEN